MGDLALRWDAAAGAADLAVEPAFVTIAPPVVRVGMLTHLTTAFATGANRKHAICIQPTVTFTAERLYAATTAAAGAKVTLLVYADAAGEPGALLAQTAERLDAPAVAFSDPIVTPVVLLAGQRYWLVAHSEGSIALRFYATAEGVVSTSARWNDDTYADGPANPFGASFSRADTPAALGVEGPAVVEASAAASDLARDDGLETAVLLSLFTDRRAEEGDALPAGEADRRGWWADALPVVQGDRIGSRLWLLSREKETPRVLARSEEYAREALAWLVEDRVAERVEVAASIPRPGWRVLEVAIYRPHRADPVRYRFDAAWAAQEE